MKNVGTVRQQFVKNLSINLANFLTNVAYGLLMTPFLINYLGVSSFGIVQMAVSLSTFMALASSSLNMANSRYLSIYYHAKDYSKVNKTLTITFSLYLLIIVASLAPLLLVVINPSLYFSIPDGGESSAKILFLFTVFGFFMMLMTTVFMSPAYVQNRLDIMQSVNIFRNLLKLIFTVVLILLVERSMSVVGIAYFGAAFCAVVVAIKIFYKFMPDYRFRLADFDKGMTREIVLLSFWTLVSQVGMLFFLQTDIIVVNVFMGAGASGHYAIVAQWATLLISIATITSVVISPIILIKFSQGRIEELKAFIFKAVKLQGIYIAFVVGIVVVFAEDILRLWLGSEYVHLATLLRVMVCPLALTQSIRPLFALNNAYNMLRVQGLVTLVSGILHVAISVVLIKNFNTGIAGPIVSNVSFNLFLTMIFLPLYVSKYFKVSLVDLYRSILPAGFCLVIVVGCGLVVESVIDIDGFMKLILSSILTCLAAVPLVYILFLSKEDKAMLVSMIKRKKVDAQY